MLKNYLKIALRNILRSKIFSFINIAGLAVGLAVCILIMLWVNHETSFEKFNKNANNIHRVVFSYKANEDTRTHWRTPPPLAQTLKEKYPEIDDVVRFHNEGKILLSYDEKAIKFQAGYTDNSFFNIFSVPIIKGSSENLLFDPETVILNEKTATKIFGNENPIGKTISINNQFDLTITAICKTLPENTDIKFDLLMNFKRLPEVSGYGGEDDWGDFGFNTFLLLDKNTSIPSIAEKINQTVDEILPETGRKFFLQPLTSIHLYNIDGSPGAMIYVYIFSSIAIFILLIACINFMNLSTARSSKRAREIGLRKVLGAEKTQLKVQFIGESILMTFFAMLLAIGLVEVFLPVFNELAGKKLLLDYSNFNLFLSLFVLVFITGTISGIYPALKLSSMLPVKSLKGNKSASSSKFRTILVVFQFSLSIFLISSTIIISKQLSFLRKKKLGFNKENLVYLPINNDYLTNMDTFKEELKKNPQILNVCGTSSHIGIAPKWTMVADSWEGNDTQKELNLPLISCDQEFLNTFSIDMLEGSFHQKDFYTEDENFGFVLNETAVKIAGLKNPIGKKLMDGYIIGVVKDFHYRSLKTNIEPLALVAIPEWHNYVSIKIMSDNIPNTIQYIEKISKSIAPDFPFQYHFLEEEFNSLYRNEIRLGKLFNSFAILAIFISCLGLFGLVSFITEQRTKEIAIRKVLGSSILQIIGLLSSDFLKWILISNLIAWPIAFFIMDKWLQSFAFKTSISLWIFAISGLISLFISMLTVCIKTYKAANNNPVLSLQYE